MGLFGKKLFGNNIDASCEYCHHAQKVNDIFICTLNKTLTNGKCMQFSYNPLMRVPRTMPNLPKFDPKDFEI